VLTLIRADLPPPPLVVPAGYALRPCSEDDLEPLGRLYFDSYDPGEASDDLSDAIADIRAAFGGYYGDLWPEASPVATTPDGEIVAAIQVVRRAPWPGTPDCPFVIELFTARAHRRRGLARGLIGGALHAVTETPDGPQLALRVADGNHAALALYRDLDFS
jgi:GNAT superfamily N-acetyltransferase